MQIIVENEQLDEIWDGKQDSIGGNTESGKAYVGKGRRHGKRLRKTLWGLLLLVGAGALIVSKMGFLEGFGFWNILFSVILLGVLLSGIAKRSFGQMLFSLAFLVIVNDELLKLEAITPWPVLGAALLGTVGLNMLFPRFGKSVLFCRGGHRRGIVNEESRDGGSISFENAFGESVKYITGEISDVKIESSFGSMEIYFSDAVLKDNKACIHVEASFGKVVLYVPADWKVVMNVDTAFGNAVAKGHCEPGGENVLYVDGEAAFGNLTIQHI